jgi:hypothetical protein
MNHSIPTPAVGQNTPKPFGRGPHAFTIARRKLQPGQAGTKKLLAEYGERLVCVRYRYDRENKRRIKTVELVIAEGPWQPRPAKIPANAMMHLRITYGEVVLRNLVKAAGGKWNRDQQAWELPYHEVVRLGLAERIVRNHKRRGDAFDAKMHRAGKNYKLEQADG